MKVQSNLEIEIKAILKEILLKALLPQAILTIGYIFLHWFIVSLWLYLNYEEINNVKLLLIVLLGGSLPLFSYGVWSLRKFLIKAYLIIHNKLIKFYLKDFCDEMAHNITNKREHFIEENQHLEILLKFKVWIDKKVETLPSFIKMITTFVIKKIKHYDFNLQILALLKEANQQEISELLNKEISNLLVEGSNRVIPFSVIYLIPLNVILLIGLWFY